jgi:glycosyltransferase involved in cell wall biosynthesis
MKYLICQEWKNTSCNHTGMKHMCLLLKKKYPNDYEVIIFPCFFYEKRLNIYIMRKIYGIFVQKILIPYKYKKIGEIIFKKLGINDQIYLLEYCGLLFPQIVLAKYIRKKNKLIKIYGLVHLVPQILDKQFTKKTLQKWIMPLDMVLTLGSSLSSYFRIRMNLPESKVKTLFLYVDLEFYKPLDICFSEQDTTTRSTPKIIVMGNMERNYEILKKIVSENPQINFTICQGMLNLEKVFENCTNVDLRGFMDEADLLYLMQNADISLNIMDDTIGSNVITTSMAVGLAMIVSDVGSIKDYCQNDGAIYCKNEDPTSFSVAINELVQDKNKLNDLKQKSLINSQRFSIQKFNQVIQTLY